MEDRKYYHYVFTTYKRQFILNEDIKKYLQAWFHDIAKEKMFKIVAMSILGDHVHLLVEQKINDAPEYIMKCIKGASSHRLFKFYPNTDRFVYRKLWGSSYNCREIPEPELKTIVNYIGNQTDKMGVDKRFKAGYKVEPRRSASGG
ncbi:MAG: IS200/IS605 family transposase [bacterium]